MVSVGDKKYNFNLSKDLDNKYEVTKLLIILNLLRKNNTPYFYIYTEHEVNDEVVSIYVEDIRNKYTKIFEIKKKASEEYILRKEQEGEKIVRPFFNKAYWRVISLESLSDNLIELNKEIEEELKF